MFYIFVIYLFTFTNAQLIIYCNNHNDCYPNYYCNNQLQCENCIDIIPNSCNALNSDCCSSKLLSQCTNNPYKCIKVIRKPDYTNSNIISLHFFLIFFLFSFISYFSLGIYYNKYILNYKGAKIIPNVNLWINTGLLVKDGIYFSFNNFSFFLNNLGRSNYESIK